MKEKLVDAAALAAAAAVGPTRLSTAVAIAERTGPFRGWNQYGIRNPHQNESSLFEHTLIQLHSLRTSRTQKLTRNLLENVGIHAAYVHALIQ